MSDRGIFESFRSDVSTGDDRQTPSPQFLAQLRTTLSLEASRIQATEAVQIRMTERTPRFPSVAPRDRALPRFPRAESLIGRFSSIALVVALLFGSIVLFTNQDGRSNNAVAPAGSIGTPAQAAIQFGNVPMPGGDVARTNVQPGPALASIPKLLSTTRVSGTSLALGEGVLFVRSGTALRAFDAGTLVELWTIDLPRGVVSAPSIVDGRIYVAIAANTESSGGRAADNLLVALSASDGHELWRVAGAGAFPAGPVVENGVVYSLGVAGDRYQLGAYGAEDGRVLWQSDVAQFSWCCPSIGIAFAQGILVVSATTTIAAFDSADGTRFWSHGPLGGSVVGPPMITGDLVIANSSNLPSGETRAMSDYGSTTALDLKSGAIKWSNEFARSYSASLSATRHGILYAGAWYAERGDRLVLLSTVTGEIVWSIPFPTPDGVIASDASISIGSAPAVVGETAYITASSSPGTVQYSASTLAAAIDLARGTVEWIAEVDGTIAAAPLVSGGRIFLLPSDKGLSVLTAGDPPTGAPETFVDLRQLVRCTQVPADSPLLGQLPAAPTIAGVAPWKQMIPFSQLPTGNASVDTATADQLAARFDEYRACSGEDPYHGVFGFFSTDFYVRLLALGESVYNSKEQPWAIWMGPMQEFLYLDTNSLRTLPDGRIGGLVNSPGLNIYVWWVRENGEWKIDEYHRIAPDQLEPNAATPPPSINAEGTPLG